MKKLVSITAIALVLALALGGAAFAADKIWPKGTPTVIVGFGAGGGTDTSVRPMIVLMSKYLGETINVANMPGAASAVAAEHVLGLPADGYTMFATGSGCFGGFKVKEPDHAAHDTLAVDRRMDVAGAIRPGLNLGGREGRHDIAPMTLPLDGGGSETWQLAA